MGRFLEPMVDAILEIEHCHRARQNRLERAIEWVIARAIDERPKLVGHWGRPWGAFWGP